MPPSRPSSLTLSYFTRPSHTFLCSLNIPSLFPSKGLCELFLAPGITQLAPFHLAPSFCATSSQEAFSDQATRIAFYSSPIMSLLYFHQSTYHWLSILLYYTANSMRAEVLVILLNRVSPESRKGTRSLWVR